MSPFYSALCARLKQDAVGAANALRRAQGSASEVTAEDIFARFSHEEGQTIVTARIGDVFSLPCASGIEALCSLVEVLHQEVTRAGGTPPLHLLGQLAHDGLVLGAYRAIVGRDPAVAAEVQEEIARRLAERGGSDG